MTYLKYNFDSGQGLFFNRFDLRQQEKPFMWRGTFLSHIIKLATSKDSVVHHVSQYRTLPFPPQTLPKAVLKW